MDIQDLGDYVECPQCGSDEEVEYAEVDGVIYIKCTACGYFEEADFLELSTKNDSEEEIYINSTAKKEKLPEDEQWDYYNFYLKDH